MSTTAHSSTASYADAKLRQITRVAVAVDGYPEGRDATRLGATIAAITAAEPILVMVVSAPSAAPRWVGQEGLYDQAQATLEQVRDALLPDARVVVEHDDSVARGLERIVAQGNRDLLVVGSSRHAPEGHVRIGKRTRQLLGHAGCALAVAPRGLHHKGEFALARIGVGYDAGPEAEAALTLAGSLAHAAGAELHVHAVVDNRGVPPIDWSTMKGGPPVAERDSYVRADVELLRERTRDAAQAVDPGVEVEVHRGRPADALLEMSTHVDLIVIGSRRWGAVAHLLLGSTGEALLHDAQCPVLVVPRTDR
ncbi:MAG TPA: universal stress protein [Solirubrobacteraceae bacterium]|nr:universal stress protein [Solirubrobacteraceae bacterium]